MHTCFVHWLSVGHANDTLHLSLLACCSKAKLDLIIPNQTLRENVSPTVIAYWHQRHLCSARIIQTLKEKHANCKLH